MNAFVPNAPFLYSLFFRGQRKGALGTNGSKCSAHDILFMITDIDI